MLWTWIKNADDDHSFYNAIYFTTTDIKSKVGTAESCGGKGQLNFSQESECRFTPLYLVLHLLMVRPHFQLPFLGCWHLNTHTHTGISKLQMKSLYILFIRFNFGYTGVLVRKPPDWPLSLSVALSHSDHERVLMSGRLWDSLSGLDWKWRPSVALETNACEEKKKKPL